MSHVLHRAPSLPVAVSAQGVWITDARGKRYLDACGGAIVNGVGHGRRDVAEAISGQITTVDYVHAHSFTTDALERYAERLSPLLPVQDPVVFPVSGGSEAAESAIKLARSYHLARGEQDRTVVLSRWGSYHGNTLGALDASGRLGLREGYEPWLGRFEHLPAVNEYRCPNPDHPDGCGAWHAARLDETVRRIGPDRVAAFVAEPIGGATTGATVPPIGYWPAIRSVCSRYGILLIVDEVMTGFGRTGRWFGLDHFGVTADILMIAKGAASGYWPFGACVASRPVADAASDRFHHGHTYSHHPVGAAAANAVLSLIQTEGLVERSGAMGEVLRTRLRAQIGNHHHVGDVRGLGLLVGVELVEDPGAKRPFDRSALVTERVRTAMIDRGVIPYPVVGCADGIRGDAVLFGPPLVVEADQIETIVAVTAAALDAVF